MNQGLQRQLRDNGQLLHHIDSLRETGRYFFDRGWSVGTSSNYSIVLQSDPLQLLVTASGMDKGRLTQDDFVIVDGTGKPAFAEQPKSSAETMLHVQAAQFADVGAILHTHSPWATVLSQLFADTGYLEIGGFEMLKGLRGITTHETTIRLPIFDNTQDIPSLAEQVKARFATGDHPPGYLIRRHGLYAWGKDVAEARRHIEIFEFLMECFARECQITGRLLP